jgi:hypothetical protein
VAGGFSDAGDCGFCGQAGDGIVVEDLPASGGDRGGDGGGFEGCRRAAAAGAWSQGCGVGADLGVSADAASRGEDAHLDTEKRRQLVVQRGEVEQAAAGLEGDEQIDVARRPVVAAGD